MDGRCFRCTSKFGVFKKEIACNKCGYGFCKKCLVHDTQLTPSNSSVTQLLPLCGKCFKTLNHDATTNEMPSKGSNEDKFSDVPENFRKRVAALQETKGGPPRIGSELKLENTSSADQKLATRLEKLKEDRKKASCTVASVEEMEKRLRVLKGLNTDNPEIGQTSKVYQAPDTSTKQEQSEDLMAQMKEEVNLDNRLKDVNLDKDNCDLTSYSEMETKTLDEEARNMIDEAKKEIQMEQDGMKENDAIEERIAQLRGMDLQTYRDKGKKELEEMSEAEATKRYISQLMDENRLNEKMEREGYKPLLDEAKSSYADKTKSTEPDELPWCCICNEDAELRCLDCDNDLYCKRCFREGHDEFDMKYHKTSRYRMPKDSNG